MINFDKDLYSVQEARNLCKLGSAAADKIADYTDEQIDKIIQNMVCVAEKNAVSLAEMAVAETGFGKAQDKTIKNLIASKMVYESIKGMKTSGVIKEDTVNGVIDIASPMGLLMGITPSTNPTATAIYKSIITIKSRNAIVFSPHPAAVKCTNAAVELMKNAAVEAGAPENTISCLSMSSMEASNELMHNPNIKLVLATGGPGMVKAAYSAGKPAIGVGAGNSPAYIERTADVKKAVKNIFDSKTFDYGTICASEQAIVCEECNRDEVIREVKIQGGYFMTPEETDKVCSILFRNGHTMNAGFVGRAPQVIADAAGISIPAGTRLLVGEQKGVGPGYPLSYEKLTQVIGFYTVKDWKEACDICLGLLQHGLGHTLSLHTESRDIVMKFAKKPAGRIVVNTGSAQGGSGGTTGLSPALTLGCGTWGGSSVSENVTPMHLINIKKVAYGTISCDDLAASFQYVNTNSTCAVTNTGQMCGLSPSTFVTGSQVSQSSQTSASDYEMTKMVAQIVKALKELN